ncbi:MAG: ABC transporter substrate-binding protein [Candidatus Omnitrophota bacterium]
MAGREPQSGTLRAFGNKWFAPAVIVLAFVWAAATVAMHVMRRDRDDGLIVLRIGHWQLEPGVRIGLNEMAAEYQKQHPRVRIVQEAIPEGVYGQWSSTQFMGGTAPDIIEMGLGLPPAITVSYYNRYCLRFSDLVNRPNPYNQGTEFENTSLRNTYKDGMIQSYIPELKEYMNVPLSQFAQRLFYNRDLYRRLTGKETPPSDWQGFMADCQRIAATKIPGTTLCYTPVVGSQYHIGYWDGAVLDLATWRLFEVADFNRDYYVGTDELFAASALGLLDLSKTPAIRKRFELARQITSHMQPGFTGLTRDEGVFKFARQQAVFIPTGTWDVGSLITQAEGKFEVGIADFPIPAPEDPDYGHWIPSPRFEKPSAGFNFTVTKFSRHPAVAVDFLLFLASKRGNEVFNRRVGWIPAIKNTEMTEILKQFKPTTEGILGNFNYNLGGNTSVFYSQMYSLFQVKQIGLNDFLDKLAAYYKTKGAEDFDEQQKDWRRSAPATERISAVRRMDALESNPGTQGCRVAWRKYRNGSLDLVGGELNRWRLVTMIKAGGKPLAPYAYSAAALDNIRRQVREKADGQPAPAVPGR